MNSEKSEKKAYVSPSMEEIDMECMSILCESSLDAECEGAHCND